MLYRIYFSANGKSRFNGRGEKSNDLSRIHRLEKANLIRRGIKVEAIRKKNGNGYGRISHSLHTDKNPYKRTVNFNPPRNLNTMTL